MAICVSLPSFAFDLCDFSPYRINGKIIRELVSWKSWYSRHWVKPLGLPSLIVLRLFSSFHHLKFSWRDFSASQGKNSSVHFNVFNLSEILLCMWQDSKFTWIWIRPGYKPIASDSITVFAGFSPRRVFVHAFEPVNSPTIINSKMSPVRFFFLSLLRWVGYLRASLTQAWPWGNWLHVKNESFLMFSRKHSAQQRK